MITTETTPAVHGFTWDGARWRMPSASAPLFAVYGKSGEPVPRDGFDGARRCGARGWVSAAGEEIVPRAEGEKRWGYR